MSLSRAATTTLRSSALQRSSIISQRRFASGGGSSYNQPTGYLFGEKPPPPGQKRQKEDWESLWTWGMFGGMAFGALLLWYKPDTSIQTWARAEAEKRLEASGENYKYEPSANSGHPDGVKGL